MWKLQSVFALFHPARYRQIKFIKTDTAALCWGWGIWFSSVLTRPFASFLPDQYKKLRDRNRLLVRGPFFVLGSVSSSEWVFSPDESLALDSGLLAFISFSQGRHSIVLSKEEAEIRGWGLPGHWGCWTDFSRCSHRELQAPCPRDQ